MVVGPFRSGTGRVDALVDALGQHDHGEVGGGGGDDRRVGDPQPGEAVDGAADAVRFVPAGNGVVTGFR
jgi:hypothetical protein